MASSTPDVLEHIAAAFAAAVPLSVDQLRGNNVRGVVIHVDIDGGEPVYASADTGTGPKGRTPLSGQHWAEFSTALTTFRQQLQGTNKRLAKLRREEMLLRCTNVLQKLAAAGLFAGIEGDGPAAVIHDRGDGDDWLAVYDRYLDFDAHWSKLVRQKRRASTAAARSKPAAPLVRPHHDDALTKTFDDIVRLDVVDVVRAGPFVHDNFDEVAVVIGFVASRSPGLGPKFMLGSTQAGERALALYTDLKHRRDHGDHDGYNRRIRTAAAQLGRRYEDLRESCTNMFEPDVDGRCHQPAFEAALRTGKLPASLHFFGSLMFNPETTRRERFLQLVFDYEDYLDDVEDEALKRQVVTELKILLFEKLPRRLVEQNLLDGLQLAEPWTLQVRGLLQEAGVVRNWQEHAPPKRRGPE